MKIPLVVNLGPDGTIIEGPYKGQQHHYKTALYNSLIALKPCVCLEVGTLHGGTVGVFERYFKEFPCQGVVVTADIKLYKDVSSIHTVQVQVYPHAATFGLHNVTAADVLPCSDRLWSQSVELNTSILREVLDNIGADAYDLAFIDGDHRKVSAMKDIAIAKALTKPPHYILLEDVRESIHEVSSYYAEEVGKEWNHYDFLDWPCLAGCALIWEKEE